MNVYKKIAGEICYLSPKSEDYGFNIVDIMSDHVLGFVSLLNVNPLYQNSSMIIKIDTEHDRASYAIEGIKLVLDFAFNCLNMHTVSINLPDNKVDLILWYKSAGFKIMGSRRESKIVNGIKHNEVFMDILSTEYESIYIKNILSDMESYNNS